MIDLEHRERGSTNLSDDEISDKLIKMLYAKQNLAEEDLEEINAFLREMGADRGLVISFNDRRLSSHQIRGMTQVMKNLGSVLSGTNVISLTIEIVRRDHINISDCMRELCLGLVNSNLRHLNLNSYHIDDTALSYITPLISVLELKSFCLVDNSLSDIGVSTLAAALPGSSLVSLTYSASSNSHASADGIKPLLASIKQSDITNLSLFSVHYSRELFQQLIDLITNHTIYTLDLSDGEINNEDRENLLLALPNTTIVALHLNNMSIYYDGYDPDNKYVAAFLVFTTVSVPMALDLAYPSFPPFSSVVPSLVVARSFYTNYKRNQSICQSIKAASIVNFSIREDMITFPKEYKDALVARRDELLNLPRDLLSLAFMQNKPQLSSALMLHNNMTREEECNYALGIIANLPPDLTTEVMSFFPLMMGPSGQNIAVKYLNQLSLINERRIAVGNAPLACVDDRKPWFSPILNAFGYNGARASASDSGRKRTADDKFEDDLSESQPLSKRPRKRE